MPRHALTAIAMGGAAGLFAAPPICAKEPGTTYCYRDVCHRVLTISETAKEVGKQTTLTASYYDAPWRDPFNPSLATSSGETFRPLDDDTAASPIYPDGTRLLVFAPESGGAAIVRINDAGPYWAGRMLDVSRGVAEKLGFLNRGVSQVVTIVLAAPTASEARYESGKTYEPVPGYMGEFANLDAAHAAWRDSPDGKVAAAAPPPADDPTPRPERVVIIPDPDEAAADNPGPAKETKTADARDNKTAGAKDATTKAGKNASRARNRVVLKPVKQRRPLVLAAIAKRKARVAENDPSDKDDKPKARR